MAASLPELGRGPAPEASAPPQIRPLPLAIVQRSLPAEGGRDDVPSTPALMPEAPAQKSAEEREAAGPIDLVKLAQDVLPHLKRLMLVERERRTKG
jgi:hypothetical protein